ncbi:MAG TPA: dihydrofolate reductase family protein [Jiangellaceae bacterium]
MRTIAAHYFISLDGVIDAPQDWHFPYVTPDVMEAIEATMEGVDALLLGRRTFEEWKAYWPDQSGFPLADFINGTHKYVVTDTVTDLGWGPATVVSGNVETKVADLKAEAGGRIAVNGSGTLGRTLLQAGLIDELHLLVHPVVVGTGKHLFEAGETPVGLELAELRTYTNGVTYQIYRPAAAAPAAE